MNFVSRWQQEKGNEQVAPAINAGQVAKEICEKALNDAKAQLHPLLRSAEIDRLDRRQEFVQAFKTALGKRVARKLSVWQPGVQAVFQFDETRTDSVETWDGSVHLLVKTPRPSKGLKVLGKTLDKGLVNHLKQLNWPRFRTRESILEVQQVTLNELRHGIGYGAMFYAVYTVPVKVWP